jgi:hypothetical protein
MKPRRLKEKFCQLKNKIQKRNRHCRDLEAFSLRFGPQTEVSLVTERSDGAIVKSLVVSHSAGPALGILRMCGS